MRRIFIFALLTIITNIISAQPNWAKKAAGAVFTLKTFSADGAMIAGSNGFFIGENGEAVSCLSPFRGASRAIIIDSKGKEMSVDCILGANETYDVVKFHVNAKRTVALAIDTTTAATGSTAWLLPYTSGKKPNPLKGDVSKAETFNDMFAYYTISINAPDNAIGCPFLNESGEAIGLLQPAAKSNAATCFAVSAAFANSLKMNGLSINDAALKSIGIKKAMPDELSQAILTMYIAGSTLDSIAYKNLVEDFIVKFPESSDGYIYRAQLNADANRFAEADRDMEQAIKVADKKDNAHYSYARLIYQKELYKNNVPYGPWTLDKAAEEADMAYSINPIPTYRQTTAQIRMAQKRYDEAYNIYKELIDDGTRTSEVFYLASRCKEMQNDTTAMIALLDSAVNTFTKPYLKAAAPYLLARAQAYDKAGMFRKAVVDYNDYEKLMSSQLNDNFYYIRSQAETNGRMFQQAIEDIDKAISMNPERDFYYAEKASILVRVGLLDEAIAASRECIRLAPESSDGYLFLGLAQCMKGDKAEGIKHLEKARELGDTQAMELIEKYK